MGRENPQTKRFLVQFKKCIHCGQLILRKIGKIGATRCQILRLKCTEFDFPRPRWGSLQRSPRSLAVLRGLLLTGGEGGERGREVLEGPHCH